jgi:hypothetical protein
MEKERIGIHLRAPFRTLQLNNLWTIRQSASMTFLLVVRRTTRGYDDQPDRIPATLDMARAR